MRVFGYVSAVVLCVLVGFFGALALTQGVQADGMRAPLYYIKAQLVNDYMKYHGRQLKSYHLRPAEPDVWILLEVLPQDRRFIVTDFRKSSGTAHIGPSTDLLTSYYSIPAGYSTFVSGIVFEPGESIYLYCSGSYQEVIISGYYVDMPQP